MRDYVCGFMKEYGYPQAAAEVLLNAYDSMMANDGAREVWESALALYDADLYCDYKEIIARADRVADAIGAHEYTTELLVFMCMSRRLRERYVERGIDLDYYRKSMADLRYKLDECALVYGIVGSFWIDVCFWGICALSILYFFMRFYIYLLLVTFDLSIRKILKNALIFTMLGIKRNLMGFLGVALITLVNVAL